VRLFAALGLAMFPFAVATYTALHYDAMGADAGVLWCIALLAVVVGIGVIGAHLERRMSS
jgi:ABC-type transport system involved in cytochrome c biogenesis permease component